MITWFVLIYMLCMCMIYTDMVCIDLYVVYVCDICIHVYVITAYMDV
jgi:hypothetical protein